MSIVVAKRNTFLVPSGTATNEDGKHLFVVVTDRCKDNQHLLLPICSIRDGVHHDPTCVIQAGEHPFIKWPSYILYAKAAQAHSDRIAKLVGGWVYIQKEDCEEALFGRIRAGIKTSIFMPRWGRTYFAANE